MKHELIFLGRAKDTFIADGVHHYVKRLEHYTSLQITTLKEKGRGKKGQMLRELEGQLLLDAVAGGATVVVLDPKGHQFSSVGLAEKIVSWENQGIRQVTYLIGGPEGHSLRVPATLPPHHQHGPVPGKADRLRLGTRALGE